MTITAEMLDAMVEAGCTAEQIAAVVKAGLPMKASRQERNARYYQSRKERLNASENRLKTSYTSEQDAKVFPTSSPLDPPPTPPPYNPPTTTLSKFSSQREREKLFDDEFEHAFWPEYPNKVGKPKARASFRKARLKAELETIMAGLCAYTGKLDDRPWCNPETWLNQERWADAPATVEPQARSQAPPRVSEHVRRHQEARRILEESILSRRQSKDEHPDGKTIEHDDDNWSPFGTIIGGRQ